MEKELLKAEKLKGKKLTENEKFLVSQFWDNPEFELKLYSNQRIGYHRING